MRHSTFYAENQHNWSLMNGLFWVWCWACWNLDFASIYIRYLFPLLSHTLLRASVWISHITHTFQMRGTKYTSFFFHHHHFFFFTFQWSQKDLPHFFYTHFYSLSSNCSLFLKKQHVSRCHSSEKPLGIQRVSETDMPSGISDLWCSSIRFRMYSTIFLWWSLWRNIHSIAVPFIYH